MFFAGEQDLGPISGLSWYPPAWTPELAELVVVDCPGDIDECDLEQDDCHVPPQPNRDKKRLGRLTLGPSSKREGNFLRFEGMDLVRYR